MTSSSSSSCCVTRRSRRRRLAAPVLIVLLCCASLALTHGQDTGGSTTPEPSTAEPPTTTTPVATTASPPAVTTAPPTITKKPKPNTTPAPTVGPVETVAPEPTTATTTTATPTVTKKRTNATEVVEATVEPATILPEATDESATTNGGLTTSGTIPKSGASYGSKAGSSSSSSSSSSKEGTTTSKAGGASSQGIMHFMMVVAGLFGVVLMGAGAVFYHKKRQEDAMQDLEAAHQDEDKYHTNTSTKQGRAPVVLAMETNNTSTPYDNTMGSSTATAYRDFNATPAAATAAVPAYSAYGQQQPQYQTNTQNQFQNQATDQVANKPLAVSAFRDTENAITKATSSSMASTPMGMNGSRILTTAAAAGVGASFFSRNRGENDVCGGDDDFTPNSSSVVARSTLTKSRMHQQPAEEFRGTASNTRLTKCRGHSEDWTTDDSDSPSHHGQIRGSSAIGDPYNSSQMFVLSDSEGEDDDIDSSFISVDRLTTGNGTSRARGPDNSVDIDLDDDIDDDDEEDIVGRPSASPSGYVMSGGELTRISTSSCLEEFHDASASPRSRVFSSVEEFEV